MNNQNRMSIHRIGNQKAYLYTPTEQYFNQFSKPVIKNNLTLQARAQRRIPQIEYVGILNRFFEKLYIIQKQ